MKKYLFISITLVLLYYLISISTMHGKFKVEHYFKYETIEQARKQNGLIKANLPYRLVGFNNKQEKLIRDNIYVYSTKSHFQTFYGFWINIKSEDIEMMRIELDIINDSSYVKLPNAQINFNGKYWGEITKCSINIYRKEEVVKLDVIEYQNHKPIKLGEIIVVLD